MYSQKTIQESEATAAIIEAHLATTHGWSVSDGDPVIVDKLCSELLGQHNLKCDLIAAGMLKLQDTHLGFVDRQGTVLSVAQFVADGGTRVLMCGTSVYQGFEPINI